MVDIVIIIFEKLKENLHKPDSQINKLGKLESERW